MMYALGIISGICLCTFVVVLEIWLSNRSVGANKLRHIIKQHMKTQADQPGINKKVESHIIGASSLKQMTAEKLIKENEQKGVDTPIDKIYGN